MQRGQPSWFAAAIRYNSRYDGRRRNYDLRVNHPLIVDGVQVFLIGHGYAPEFKVTDSTGHVKFDQAVPFIPVEQSGLTSAGVIKVPDAQPRQLGFAGVFLPTEIDVGGRLASAFPAADFPRVSLVSYAGNLGLDSGQPQSVYNLDTSRMRRLAVSPRPLAPGQSIVLRTGLGKLTFTGYRQWVSLAITYDPGPGTRAGVGAGRAGGPDPVVPGPAPADLRAGGPGYGQATGGDGGLAAAADVEVAGLTRSDAAGGFETEFAELSSEIMQEVRGAAAAAGQPGGVTRGSRAKGRVSRRA